MLYIFWIWEQHPFKIISQAVSKIVASGSVVLLGSIFYIFSGPQLSQLCAYGNGRDTCEGDSGGPLTIEMKEVNVLLGITSYGSEHCGEKG